VEYSSPNCHEKTNFSKGKTSSYNKLQAAWVSPLLWQGCSATDCCDQPQRPDGMSARNLLLEYIVKHMHHSKYTYLCSAVCWKQRTNCNCIHTIPSRKTCDL